MRLWRRIRGGRWTKVTGLLWGKRWVKLPPGSSDPCIENWGGSLPKRLYWWWINHVVVPIDVKLSSFHLLRHRETGHFIIVWLWPWSEQFEVDGYYIESHHITPWSARRHIKSVLHFDALMNHLGPRGRSILGEAIAKNIAEEERTREDKP